MTGNWKNLTRAEQIAKFNFSPRMKVFLNAALLATVAFGLVYGNPNPECVATFEGIIYGLGGCGRPEGSEGCDGGVGCCGPDYTVSVLPIHYIQLVQKYLYWLLIGFLIAFNSTPQSPLEMQLETQMGTGKSSISISTFCHNLMNLQLDYQRSDGTSSLGQISG